MFKKLIENYKKRYQIPFLDLADAGESNRIVIHITSIMLFLFGVITVVCSVIMHHASLLKHKVSLIYFGIYILIGVYGFLATRQKKSIERSKEYVRKTIPFYIVMYTAFGAGLYNFYFLGQPFNGFLTFCLTAFIALCTCSFSPMLFLIGLTISIGLMTPGLYHSFKATGLTDAIGAVILMFCLSLYKRRAEKKHIQFLKKQKQSLEAKTFGNFTLMYENKVVKFSRTKSDELLGYLIYKKGSSVKTKELISVLWGEHADSARYGSSVRNLIVDIKHTLGELQIQNFFIAEYNNFRINPEVIKCDYYDFLNGEKPAIQSFSGEFMSQYSWAEDAVAFLEQKALKK